MANERMETQGSENRRHVLSSFVRRYCERDVVCTTANAPLTELAKLMRENHVGDVVIVDDQAHPIGIVTDRDLVIQVAAEGRSFDELRASDIMTRDIAVARATDPAEEMVRTMRRQGVGRLPLIDDQGVLVGIITAKNVMQWLVSELEQLMEGAEKQQDREQELTH